MSVSNNSFTSMYGEETINTIDELFNRNALDDVVMLLESPTGTGKSYFIKNLLYDYCQLHNYKVLYLVPRIAVKNEFYIELSKSKKNDIITVETYQKLEKEDQLFDLNLYDIIVCDECHYFTSDSLFNPHTEISYNHILSTNHKLRFFMTATSHPFLCKLHKDFNDKKTINPDVHHGVLWLKQEQEVSPIKDLRFFPMGYTEQKRQYIESILNEIMDEKVIVFCNSKKYAYDLYKRYKDDSMFICSQYDDNYSQHIDEEAYTQMLKDHRFNCKYLFCTSALDVGFSIKDKQVKHIICMLDDWNSIVQAIGRKRMLDHNDTVTIYLPDRTNQRIGQMWSKLNEIMEHYYYYNQHGSIEYLNRYSKRPDPYRIIYYQNNGDGTCKPAIDYFVLNYYSGITDNLSEIRQMVSPFQYRDWVRKRLGLPVMCKEKTVDEIEKELQHFIDNGRVFTKDDLHEVSDIICYIDTRTGDYFRSVKKLNQHLESICAHVRIVQGTERTTINGKDKKTTVYYLEAIE